MIAYAQVDSSVLLVIIPGIVLLTYGAVMSKSIGSSRLMYAMAAVLWLMFALVVWQHREVVIGHSSRGFYRVMLLALIVLAICYLVFCMRVRSSRVPVRRERS